MKAYLITTGSLFGLMAVVHVTRAFDEHVSWSGDHAQFFFMALLILIPAALSAWAWRLLARRGR